MTEAVDCVRDDVMRAPDNVRRAGGPNSKEMCVLDRVSEAE